MGFGQIHTFNYLYPHWEKVLDRQWLREERCFGSSYQGTDTAILMGETRIALGMVVGCETAAHTLERLGDRDLGLELKQVSLLRPTLKLPTSAK